MSGKPRCGCDPYPRRTCDCHGEECSSQKAQAGDGPPLAPSARARECLDTIGASGETRPDLQATEAIGPRCESRSGALDRARTCDPQLRRLVLYPTELRARTAIRSRQPAVGIRQSQRGCRFPAAGSRMPIPGCRFPVADCRFPVPVLRLVRQILDLLERFGLRRQLGAASRHLVALQQVSEDVDLRCRRDGPGIARRHGLPDAIEQIAD